jgi:endo-1,4-beta-xylanase
MTRRVSIWRSLFAIGAALGLIAPVALTAPPVARAADTVVSSVNFDDSTLGTWSQSGAPTLAYVDDGKGGKALSFTRAADFEGIQSPAGILAADTSYTFSMRAMLDPAGTATSADVRFVVKPKYNWVGNATINNSTWTTLSGTYTLPADAAPADAQIYIGSADASDATPYTILVDDILITVPPVKPAQVTIDSVNFDDSTLGTWSQSGAPTLAYVDDGKGGKALSFTRAADYEGIQSAAGILAAGTEYTFSMRAMLDPAGTVTSGDVRFVVKPNYTWVGNTTINNTGWTAISGTYTVPADVTDLTQVQIYIGSADQTGPYAILVDDILITGPKPVPTVQTISAVTFDDSTLGTWSQSGAPTLAYVDDGKGGKALSFTRAADYEGIQSPTGLLQPDVEYTFSMRAMLDPAGTVTSSDVRFVVKPKYNWVGNATINNSTWTTLSGTYTLPADAAPADAQIYIGSADQTGPYTILVDDILITAPPSTGGTGVLNSDCSGGYVALTYDDGPYAGNTDKLIAALDAAHLRATFFDWGEHVAGNEALVTAQAANGWIGNHTWDHPDLTTLTQDQITAELSQTQNALQAVTGSAPVLIRPPYGSTNATLKSVEASLGLTEVIWDVDSQDWNGASTAQIVARVRSATAGQVVLMHDNLATTRAAIPLIADAFTARKMCPGMINPATGKAIAPPAQTFLSTDFENGLDGWVARDSQGTPTVAVTTDEAHSPTHAALVSNRAGQGDGIGHDMAGLKQGTTYVITAWVKFAAGSPTDSLWLSMRRTNAGTDTYDTVAQFTNVSGDTWKQVTATYTMAAAETAFMYFETKYPDGTAASFLIDDVSIATQAGPSVQKDLTNLKDTVTFPVGVAIDSRETTGAYAELLTKHFDQITPENHMKVEAWYDADKNFRINPEAKALMDFAAANNVRVYGHTLLWHQQTPDWFFQAADGTALTSSDADKAILRARLHDHIFNVAQTLGSLYGPFGSATNPLIGFDVVNEVISDSSSDLDGLRKSAWYNVLGEEYIEDAFNYAEQAFNVQYAAAGVTRPVKLAINDYNTEQPAKRQRLHDLVSLLLSRNVPVDIVGHQFHVSLSTNVQTLDDALSAFEDLPVMQDVSELDVMTGTPVDDAKLIDQGYFYRDAFRIFRAHASKMFSVTIWGLYDGRSWRSDNDPLLFTDALQAKPAFYGAIDGRLAPPVRTANVFAADVPLDGAATTNPEWKKLPLHTFGDSGKDGFQLRWQAEHLSAYVTVKDAGVDATDAVTFKAGTATYAFKRDGTGDVPGQVTEVAGGWVAVVHLPLTDAKANDQVQFDVAVTDGAATTGWNDPGATGTLTLVEPISFVEIAPTPTAPTIDGQEDAVWAFANTVSTDKQVSGTATAGATAKTLWMGNTLYVLMHVVDPTLDNTGSDPWQQDSVEIYVDNVNAKNGSYRSDDTQIRISYTNLTSFGTGDEAAQKARLVSATRTVSDGYVVEAAISLLEAGGADSYVGVDFQVNDASAGKRDGIRNWADATNAGYLNTGHWGVGRLAPDMTVPALQLSSPLYLTATAKDGYHGLTAAIAGVIATDAFDPPSALTITSSAPNVLPIGTTVVTWRVTDAAGNTSTAQQVVTVARRVQTNLVYLGERLERVATNSTFATGAILLSSKSTCRAGMTLTVTLNRDPITGNTTPVQLGTATTDRFGMAALRVPSGDWKPGRYLVTVAFAGNNMGCLASSDSAWITVLAPAPWHYGRIAQAGIGTPSFGAPADLPRQVVL